MSLKIQVLSINIFMYFIVLPCLNQACHNLERKNKMNNFLSNFNPVYHKNSKLIPIHFTNVVALETELI